MQFLRLLFQLLEASLSINIDGVFCDLALRMACVSRGCTQPEPGAYGAGSRREPVGNIRG